MSTLRVDNIKSRTGSVVTVPETNTLAVTGIVSVTSTGSITNAGNLTNTGALNVTGGGTFNTTGVGTFGSLNVSNATTFSSDVQVGGALTVTGNFTVNGTTTTIDTVNLVVEDKNIGIGTTTAPSNTTADGGGLTIFGGAGGDKTWTWERGSSSFVYSDPNKFKGVLETVAAATTYVSGNNLVLELDVRNATTYTYTIPTGANIGIVSFKNMPAFTGNANGTTLTCIFTQMSSTPAGTGNTTGTTGIGTNCFVTGYEKEWQLAPSHLMSAPMLAKAEESLEVLPPASDLEPWKD